MAPDSPAAKAGLRQDDFITAMDGQPLTTSQELRMKVATLPPNSQHTFHVIRQGKEMDVRVTVAEQPENLSTVFTPGRRGGPQGGAVRAETANRLGLSVQALTPELAQRLGYPAAKGVVVTALSAGSDAAERGIRPGMLIRRVGDRDIATLADFTDAVGKAGTDKPVRLYVETPDGGGLYVIVTPSKETPSPESGTGTDESGAGGADQSDNGGGAEG